MHQLLPIEDVFELHGQRIAIAIDGLEVFLDDCVSVKASVMMYCASPDRVKEDLPFLEFVTFIDPLLLQFEPLFLLLGVG